MFTGLRALLHDILGRRVPYRDVLEKSTYSLVLAKKRLGTREKKHFPKEVRAAKAFEQG